MQRRQYNVLLLLVTILFLAACSGDESENGASPMRGDEVEPGMMDEENASEEVGPGTMGGTAWGDGAFESNGERIYFTGTSERSGEIEYQGGPDTGGMMMGGRLSCASCHGPNARGGRHQMHMTVMDAPNIRWDALAGHGAEDDDHAAEEDDHASEEDRHGEESEDYTLETFRLAVLAGRHPNGEPLSEEMPRWQMSDADLRDLAAYLQSLPGE